MTQTTAIAVRLADAVAHATPRLRRITSERSALHRKSGDVLQVTVAKAIDRCRSLAPRMGY
jgi:hypothetical protein